MNSTLVANEYCWVVSHKSPDDGLYQPRAYFTCKQRADKFASEMKDTVVVQTTLYRDTVTQEFYMIRQTRVAVDLPSRDAVLRKLSPGEREVLGLN